MRNDEHTKYYHDGKEIPSCSTIAKMLDKPELVDWANYMGFKGYSTKDYINLRKDYGNACHELFELYFGNGLVATHGGDELLSDDEMFLVINKFKIIERFFTEANLKVLANEFFMEGSTYGGTLDLLLHDLNKDTLMILDLKTSKVIRREHWLQVMGYAQLLEEIYELPVSDVGIILLSKPHNSKDLITIRSTQDCQNELQIFNHLKDIYYLLNEKKEDE